MEIRIGQGIDVHPFCEGRPLILGGIEIPSPRGLTGHSDADALTHALMDALLGAAGKEDIGKFFPNTDPSLKNISSIELLRRTWKILSEEKWKVGNIDLTLLCEKPKIASYVIKMKENFSSVLGISTAQIGIKATTTEKLGFVGREEGILASAVVLLTR